MKTRISVTSIIVILIFSSLQHVEAAQLTVNINPQNPQSEFTAKYQTTVQIDYSKGGKMKDLLKDKDWTIRKTIDSTNSYAADLASRLNQKLEQDGSSARISDLSLMYNADLEGSNNNASIKYDVIMSGTLSDYILTQYAIDESRPALIDMGWRGITISGPVMIEDGYDINLPISAIMEKEPEVYAMMESYPKVADLLSANIIDANGIQYKPLHDWHFLFDPTGLLGPEASEFDGIPESQGFVMSELSLGKNRLPTIDGDIVKNASSESFVADAEYSVEITRPPNSASIRIVGFAALDTLGGVEVLGVTPVPPEGFAVTTTGEIPVELMYGLPITLTVAAAIIGYFLFKKGTNFF